VRHGRNTYKPVDDFEFLGLFASDKPKHVDRLTPTENNEWGYRGVWSIPSVRSNAVHSAGYPVELAARAIRLLTDGGQLIFDPFLGSGTTLVACQNLSRKGRGIEICPKYVAVCLQRMKDAFPFIEIKRLRQVIDEA
jgi:DNA modification methylase